MRSFRIFAFIVSGTLASACGSLDSFGRPDLEAPASAVPLEAKYRATSMQVPAESDTDGDGVVDNQLVEALSALDQLDLPDDWDVDSFNARLADNLDAHTRVLLEAHAVGGELDLAIVSEVDGELRLDEEGVLRGELVGPSDFRAGPSDLVLPVVAFPDAPVSLMDLADANLSGELDEQGLSGRMTVILPIESIIADLVAPLVAGGWDLDGDGVPESEEQILDLAASLVPLLADTTLPDGAPGVSAVVDLEAVAEDW